jgi:hypothetical protein
MARCSIHFAAARSPANADPRRLPARVPRERAKMSPAMEVAGLRREGAVAEMRVVAAIDSDG